VDSILIILHIVVVVCKKQASATEGYFSVNFLPDALFYDTVFVSLTVKKPRYQSCFICL
jgi:hypothetical protein